MSDWKLFFDDQSQFKEDLIKKEAQVEKRENGPPGMATTAGVKKRRASGEESGYVMFHYHCHHHLVRACLDQAEAGRNGEDLHKCFEQIYQHLTSAKARICCLITGVI